MTMVKNVRLFLGSIPFSVSVTGRRRDVLFRTLDPWLRGQPECFIDTVYGRILVEWSEVAQRFFCYAASNVIRGYENSPLGRFIRSSSHIRGDLFLDVGANLGVYSLIAGSVGYESVLFEPEPSHAQYLMRNAKLYGRVIQTALSNIEGEAEFNIAKEFNPGASSLIGEIGGPSIYSKKIKVSTTLLSSLVFREKLEPGRIRLIKVDVEGAEVQVIEGMVELLSKGARPDIWCEVRGDGSGRAPGSYREVTSILSRYGYKAYLPADDGVSFSALDLKGFEAPQVFDILYRRK